MLNDILKNLNIRLRVSSLILGGAAAILSGCAEPAGSGLKVSIPTVEMTCTTARCRAAGSATAYIVFTTSSCANQAFGETVAGSTNLSCNASGCTGRVTVFTDTAGFSTSVISEGYYAICATLDFNGNYVGEAVAGQDSRGSFPSTMVDRTMTTRVLTSFTDI